MQDSHLPYGIRLLIAVAEDLRVFAVREIFSYFKVATSSDVVRGVTVSPPIYALPAHEVEEYTEDDLEPLTFKSTADLLGSLKRPQQNTVMYTGSDHVPLFQNPTVEFDGIVERIPYGAMVMVLEGRGRWSRIGYGNTVGWVLRDELIDRAAHVYPDFTIGEKNMSEDPNTLKVRACIEDEFGGGVAEVPLQSGEYALYRLYRKGKQIEWQGSRPRIAGVWHDLLKGYENVHMGIYPQAGRIMEYLQNNGEGHIAYVEAVFPDETISISEANYPDSGIYNERVLTKEEWRELHAVFIDIA